MKESWKLHKQLENEGEVLVTRRAKGDGRLWRYAASWFWPHSGTVTLPVLEDLRAIGSYNIILDTPENWPAHERT